jgi:hypothetical protein
VQPANSGFGERTATYAAGSLIHFGDRVIDVAPHTIASFVQADAGFVFTTPNGDVYVSDGKATARIGGGNTTLRLAADDEGAFVGWVDTSVTPAEFVVFDTAKESEVVRTSQGNTSAMPDRGEQAPYFHAIDDGVAYWRSGEGVVKAVIGTGTTEPVRPNASSLWLYDVANGQLARSSFDDLSVTVSADPHAEGPFYAGRGWADLSPEATYVATEPSATHVGAARNGDTGIFDVVTGADVTPPTQYRSLYLGSWLDDGSFVGVAFQRPGAAASGDLLTCSVVDRSCDVTAVDVGPLGAVQLPNGTHLTR